MLCLCALPLLPRGLLASPLLLLASIPVTKILIKNPQTGDEPVPIFVDKKTSVDEKSLQTVQTVDISTNDPSITFPRSKNEPECE
jgi:hypothetical protein